MGKFDFKPHSDNSSNTANAHGELFQDETPLKPDSVALPKLTLREAIGLSNRRETNLFPSLLFPPTPTSDHRPTSPDQRSSTQVRSPEAIAEILSRISPQDKLRILNEMSELTGLRLEQLQIVKAAFDEGISQMDSPTTRLGRLADWGTKIRSALGMSTPVRDAQNELRAEVEQFYAVDYPEITQRILEGQAPATIFREYPLIERACDKWGLDFSKDPNILDSAFSPVLLEQQGKLQQFYRGAKNYEKLAELSQELLAESMHYDLQRISEPRQKEFRQKAEEDVAKLASRYEKHWENPSEELREQGARAMSAEEIESFKEALIEEKANRYMFQEAAKTFDPRSLGASSPEQQIWKVYEDALDPKGKWLNIKDENFNMIVDEVAINAPLLVASGGTANLVRLGVSGSARILARRVLSRQAVLLAQKTAARRAALKIGGVAGTLMLEGAAFETTHTGLQGEWIGNMPDWGTRILCASAALGAFKGAHRVGERFFSRVGPGLTVQPTLLGEYVGKISNPAVRNVAKELLVQGHLSASALLVVGAAQHGVFEGDLDSFFENFGNEVLHAYVTVGALKVTHGGVESVSGTVVRASQSRAHTPSQVRSSSSTVEVDPAAIVREKVASPETTSAAKAGKSAANRAEVEIKENVVEKSSNSPSSEVARSDPLRPPLKYVGKAELAMERMTAEQRPAYERALKSYCETEMIYEHHRQARHVSGTEGTAPAQRFRTRTMFDPETRSLFDVTARFENEGTNIQPYGNVTNVEYLGILPRGGVDSNSFDVAHQTLEYSCTTGLEHRKLFRRHGLPISLLETVKCFPVTCFQKGAIRQILAMDSRTTDAFGDALAKYDVEMAIKQRVIERMRILGRPALPYEKHYGLQEGTVITIKDSKTNLEFDVKLALYSEIVGFPNELRGGPISNIIVRDAPAKPER